MERKRADRVAPKFRPKPSCIVCSERICSLPTRSGRLKSYGETLSRWRMRLVAASAMTSDSRLSIALSRLSTSAWLRTSPPILPPCRFLVAGFLRIQLLANLSVSVDHVLVACQLLKPARAAGMEFIGADADFGTEAELAAVVESSTRVDHDSRAVDTGREFAGGDI